MYKLHAFAQSGNTYKVALLLQALRQPWTAIHLPFEEFAKGIQRSDSWRQDMNPMGEIPVLEVGAKFIRPAVYDDNLTIVVTMREKPLLRIRLEYEVFRGEELLATGFSAHAFCDLTGRPTRPPPTFAERMAAKFQ